MPTLTYTVSGKQVKLTDKDYLSEGGEGKIYRKGTVAYKVYHSAASMLPLQKIKELQQISSPFIIKPTDVIFDKSGPVGYTMPFLNHSEALAKIFTTSFINRHNISYQQLVQLVQQLKSRIEEVHKAQCLVVDLNEFNYLLDDKFSNIYGIDADSYQTPSFPATAIMESIRDRHNRNFTQLTDWFSWGIISFQMLAGIHPFRGNHPAFATIKKDQVLNERMQKNISVFNPDTRLPPSVRDLNAIPKNLRSWYVEEFERGQRTVPPDNFDQVVTPTVKRTYSQSKLKTTLIHEFDENIINVFFINGRSYIFTNSKIFVDFKHHVASGIDGNLIVDGHEYLLTPDKIFLLGTIGTIKTKKIVANLLDLPNSSVPIKGGIIQNLCGSYYFYRLHGEACSQVRLKDMEGVYNKIVSGKYERGLLVLLALNNATKLYDILIYAENGDLDILHNVTPNVNVTINTAGVCVLKNDDDVYIFSRSNIFDKKVIVDANLDVDELYSDGARIYGARGNQLVQISNS